MPKQARNGSKAIKVLGQGQEMRRNERRRKRQDIEFFSNEKGPAIFCRVFSLLTVKFL